MSSNLLHSPFRSLWDQSQLSLRVSETQNTKPMTCQIRGTALEIKRGRSTIRSARLPSSTTRITRTSRLTGAALQKVAVVFLQDSSVILSRASSRRAAIWTIELAEWARSSKKSTTQWQTLIAATHRRMPKMKEPSLAWRRLDKLAKMLRCRNKSRE